MLVTTSTGGNWPILKTACIHKGQLMLTASIVPHLVLLRMQRVPKPTQTEITFAYLADTFSTSTVQNTHTRPKLFLDGTQISPSGQFSTRVCPLASGRHRIVYC